MTTPAATVFGVPLEPGERVIYFRRDDPGWQKPLMIVVGLLLLVGVIGLFLIIGGLMTSTTVYVITTKRFLIIEGARGQKVRTIRHGDVRRVTNKVGGSTVKWVDISDGGQTLLQWQGAVNAPEMPELVERYVTDPAAAAAAPSVPFEPVAGPRRKGPTG